MRRHPQRMEVNRKQRSTEKGRNGEKEKQQGEMEREGERKQWRWKK